MPRGRPKKMSAKTHEQLKKIERKPIRPLERQRMRPWLMDLLERKICHQLGWINKRLGTFRVSWKHAAGQTFDPTADATLFELWARHTGKYYPGDVPDPKKWKANFRCALHSLHDVYEDKSMGVKKGNNAFRVYRFLDEKQAKKPVARKENVVYTDDEDGSDDEFEALRNTGTRSRPKKIPQDDLDSDGSEIGNSPAHNSNHSDWEMVELRRQECEAEKSPLPNFEELYQSCPGGALLLPIPVQSSASFIPTGHLSNSDYESSDQMDNVCEEIEDEDVWIDDMTMTNYNECFWASVINSNLDVQEEVVITGENVFLGSHSYGQNVIVLSEQSISTNDLKKKTLTQNKQNYRVVVVPYTRW